MDLPPPTYRDISYSSRYEQSILDIWIPESKQPTAALVYFHGGGFTGGSKTGIAPEILELLDEQVAIISVEYPFIGQKHLQTGETIASIEEHGYHAILQESVFAVLYLIDHSEEYNLAPERIILCGSSAGAVISEYLSYSTDLKIAACIGFGQPYRIEEYGHFIQERTTPLYLFSGVATDNEVHHPRYTEMLSELCQQMNIPVAIFGNNNNDLPKVPGQKSFIEHVYSDISANWHRESQYMEIEEAPKN